nr:MAG TPA: hypothetical protein [Caudoviricetes sp.]
MLSNQPIHSSHYPLIHLLRFKFFIITYYFSY